METERLLRQFGTDMVYMFMKASEADFTGIPSAIFTIPVLALVGISTAKDSNQYKVIFRDRSGWNSSRRAGTEFAASKVIIDEANDHIMGAHILGPNAGEAINIFAAVMRLGLKASDVKKAGFLLSDHMFGYSLYAVNYPSLSLRSEEGGFLPSEIISCAL